MINRPQNYTLTELIHEGASAAIYRGRRDADGAPVVLKILNSRPSARQLAELRHEYGILRELAGEGAPLAHDLTPAGDSFALVMADTAGQSLRRLLLGGPLPLSQALRIGVAAARTLQAMHGRGIIHRDIKPHNILVREDPFAVELIDFAIASRLSHEHQEAMSPDALEGTLAYMAPEQTGRMNRPVDHRADLYALGITMYQALTGDVPFRSTDAMALIHAHIARIPPSPSEVMPTIPHVVSDLVMKLLAKVPDERYQRARSVAADLDECLQQLEETGRIAPFPLGRRDRSGELLLEGRLYGREEQERALFDAWERACQGGAELFLVKGSAGVGKSALVNEIHKGIARRGGYFISGKFDQLNRSVPYAPVLHALRELVRHLLTERDAALAAWRTAIEHALGPNGRVLTEVLPDLERIIGPQPPIAELGPTESQNRFQLVFQAFLGVFTTKAHPLVLFLDDLQWVDLGSLELLELALSMPGPRHLLVIGSYRDSEVDAAHPLATALRDLQAAGVVIGETALSSLGADQVHRLVADALAAPSDDVASLARFVFERTGGNPFFIHQVLGAMHREGQLTFDEETGEFTWDLDRIEAWLQTNDVVTFMAGEIQRLSPSAQRFLQLGAAIGHEFDLRTSLIIGEVPLAEAAEHLWEALKAGLIQPVHPEYRFVHGAPSTQQAGVNFNVSYRFLHDRVQQAAYSLIDEARSPELHLRIGRLMQEKSSQGEVAERLFEIVDHLNRGRELIVRPGERLELAQLNLVAGKRAKGSAAYGAAAGYLSTGMSLLPEDAWESQADLCFALHIERAECEYMRGALDTAESLFVTASAHARSKLEWAHVSNLRVVLYVTVGRAADAVKLGLETLRLFGIDLPDDEAAARATVDALLERVEARLASLRLQDLLDAPTLSDPEILAALKILTNLTTASWVVSPMIFAFVTASQVELSLTAGTSSIAANGYMAYAWLLAAVHGRYDQAYELGQLALTMNERFANVDLRCKLNVIFAGHINFYRRSLRSGLEYLRRAYDAGLESGDLIYLSYCCTHLIISRMSLGDELGAVSEYIEQILLLLQRTNMATSQAIQRVTRQMIANLSGRTWNRSSLSDKGFDEQEFVSARLDAGFNTFACWYYVGKLTLAFLYGDLAAARDMAGRAASRAAGSVGHLMTTELAFYACLTLLARDASAAEEAPTGDAAEIEAYAAKLHAWAESSPETFRHKELLVLAERARIEGRDEEASALYNHAIEAAATAGVVRDEALSAELCARFHMAKGRMSLARVYLMGARDNYLRWGATSKAAQLVEQHPGLLLPERQRSVQRPAEVVDNDVAFTSVSLSRRIAMELLDTTAIFRVTQMTANETVLDRVIERVLRIACEASGAQKAVLALAHEGSMRFEASLAVAPESFCHDPPVSIDDYEGAAASVLQYVARTEQNLVVADLSHDARFTRDAYVATRRPRSMACLPMRYHDRLMGLLYLENNAASGMFGGERVKICELIVMQATIAIENALLYVRVQRITDELMHSRDALALEVASQTEELSKSAMELREANRRLELELAQRARAESERSALQQEIIRRQSERIAELSTPMIPISERVVVMPLIGAIDEERGAEICAAAVHGAAQRGAAVVILDVTGVKAIGTSSLRSLVRAADGLKLLGARVIMTGISPHVARALVEHDIELGGIEMQGTLQRGIARALHLAARQRLRRS